MVPLADRRSSAETLGGHRAKEVTSLLIALQLARCVKVSDCTPNLEHIGIG